MPTLPNLIKYAQLFYTNEYMAIRDLADAFRYSYIYKFIYYLFNQIIIYSAKFL